MAANSTLIDPFLHIYTPNGPPSKLFMFKRPQVFIACLLETTAQSAKKAALRGTSGTLKKKVVTSTHFHRPKTLRLARNPKYARKSVPSVSSLDKYAILRAPLCTESAMRKIEQDNTLVFLCDVRANKHQIRRALKSLYDVDCAKVNTLIR